jgi:hypothetical protein
MRTDQTLGGRSRLMRKPVFVEVLKHDDSSFFVS